MDLSDGLGAGGGERHDLLGDDLTALRRDVEPAGNQDRLARADRGLVLPVRLRPGDHLDGAFLVLQRERGVAVALLRVAELDRVDDAADPHAGAPFPPGPLVRDRQLRTARAERSHRDVRELAQVLQVPVERMPGDEEADRLAL
jgi:hypothetical protein